MGLRLWGPVLPRPGRTPRQQKKRLVPGLVPHARSNGKEDSATARFAAALCLLCKEVEPTLTPVSLLSLSLLSPPASPSNPYSKRDLCDAAVSMVSWQPEPHWRTAGTAAPFRLSQKTVRQGEGEGDHAYPRAAHRPHCPQRPRPPLLPNFFATFRYAECVSTSKGGMDGS